MVFLQDIWSHYQKNPQGENWGNEDAAVAACSLGSCFAQPVAAAAAVSHFHGSCCRYLFWARRVPFQTVARANNFFSNEIFTLACFVYFESISFSQIESLWKFLASGCLPRKWQSPKTWANSRFCSKQWSCLAYLLLAPVAKAVKPLFCEKRSVAPSPGSSTQKNILLVGTYNGAPVKTRPLSLSHEK